MCSVKAVVCAGIMENKKVKSHDVKTNLSVQWDDMTEKGKEKDARSQVEKILNLERIIPRSNLIAPDGFFKPQLRNTVLGANDDFFQTSCIREIFNQSLVSSNYCKTN